MTASAEVAGVGRSALYTWKAQDPEFSDAWEQALVLGADALEDEARSRAMAGSEILLMFLLRGLKPERYHNYKHIDSNSNLSVSLRSAEIAALRTEIDEVVAQRVSELTPQDPLWGRLHRLLIRSPDLLEKQHGEAPAASRSCHSSQ